MCAYLGCHNVTILDALDLVPVCRIYSGLTRKTVDSNKVSGISVVAARKSCKYFKWSCVCCDVEYQYDVCFSYVKEESNNILTDVVLFDLYHNVVELQQLEIDLDAK